MKTGVSMDRVMKLMVSARKRGVFVDKIEANKKETPLKGCLRKYLVMRFLDSLRSLGMTV